MTAIVPDPSQAPAMPAGVRTTAYVCALVTGAIASGAITTAGSLAAAGIIDGHAALATSAIAGGVVSVVATIAGGLGVLYRPRSNDVG